MFHPLGGKNFVAAGDVARGIVAVLKRGHNGERYLLSGENRTYAEFYRLLAARTGCRQHLVRIPVRVLLAAGAVGDLLARLGVRSEISRTNMRILCIGK